MNASEPPPAASEPGRELPEVVFGPLAQVDIVRYAGASGDFNPIHIDPGYARAMGAPTVFAMGMLPAGFLASALSDWIGGAENLRRYEVRFTARVWPGDEIVCAGRVTEEGAGRVTIELEARRRGRGPEGFGAVEEEVAVAGRAEAEIQGRDGP